jgi:two-component system, sensor histidine kinase and response regulator
MFKLRKLLLAVFWALALIAAGQAPTVDSLQRALNSNPVDSVRINILCELSIHFLTSQPEVARKYAEEALNLSTAINYPAGKTLSLNRLAEYHWRQSNYARSVELAAQSLQLAQQQTDTASIARAYRLLGIIYTYGFRQYDVALDYHKSALAVHQRKRNLYNIASLYGNITWIYGNTGKNLDSAWLMAKRGAELADSLGSDQLLSYNYNSLGLIALRADKLDTALFYLDKSILFGKKINDKAVVAYNKSIKGDVLLKQGYPTSGVPILHEAEKESSQLNLREVLKDVYYNLSVGYDALGNFKDAYRYQRKHMVLKDSLLNWEITQKALMMQFELDEQKREVRLLELQQEAEQVRRQRNSLTIIIVIGTLIFLTIGFLIVRNNRQRKLTAKMLSIKNQEIANQNEQLTQAHEVKDKLFSIISHDLRSPLNSLKGLLGMVARNEVSEQEFKQFAPQLNQHVIGLNETLENLLQWSSSQMGAWSTQTKNFSIAPLIDKVFSLFHELASSKQITLINSIDSSFSAIADANHIELIFRNLVHNALKFTPTGGSITVTALIKDTEIDIAVIDTGIGIPNADLESLFNSSPIRNTRGTHGERGTGLGLGLCKEMAEKNGGRLTVTSEVGKGSQFHLVLKAV